MHLTYGISNEFSTVSVIRTCVALNYSVCVDITVLFDLLVILSEIFFPMKSPKGFYQFSNYNFTKR